MSDWWSDEVDRRIRRRRNLMKTEADRARACDREACEESFQYFAENYGWMFDPEADPGRRAIPFKPWPSQVDFVAWLDERVAAQEDAFVKKSRKLGITWTTLHWLLWRFLFEPDFHALLGSRKEDTVDRKGDMSALFPKLRFLIGLLPRHLLPFGEAKLRDGADNHMRLINDDLGGRLMGESSNGEFGASGRVAVVVIDEAARIPSPDLQEIWEATESVGPRLLIFNAAPTVAHFAVRQMEHIPSRMCRVMTWEADPNRPADFKASKIPPRGSMTEAQFDRSYACIDGAGRHGLILQMSRTINGYNDDSTFLISGVELPIADLRRKCPKIVGWDFGSAYRKTVATILLVVWQPRPVLLIDRVIPWGHEPFWDYERRSESALDILYHLLEREYGGQAEFHSGDASAGQKESSKKNRIDLITGYHPGDDGERRPFRWVPQERIVDPLDGEGVVEVLQVNTTPWKESIVETMIQPRLASGHLMVHLDRSSDLFDAADDWGWVLSERLSAFEAQRVHKVHHVMQKNKASDICESMMYTVNAAAWWIRAQRSSAGESMMPTPGDGVGGIFAPDSFDPMGSTPF